MFEKVWLFYIHLHWHYNQISESKKLMLQFKITLLRHDHAILCILIPFYEIYLIRFHLKLFGIFVRIFKSIRKKNYICLTTMDTLYRKLCEECFVLNSIQTSQSCCEVFQDSPFIPFKMKNLNVSYIQRALIPPASRKKCNICKAITPISVVPQHIIALDTGGGLRKISLDDIQLFIEFGGFRYRLFYLLTFPLSYWN